MQKSNLNSERSLRVNLVSMIAGLSCLGIIVLLTIGFHYNSFDLFKEIIVYKYINDETINLRGLGLIIVILNTLYLIATLLFLLDTLFSPEYERVVNVDKTVFKIYEGQYFNTKLFLMILFPITFIIGVLITYTIDYLKLKYQQYIDD